jgi:hypothetical protein
VLEGCKELNVPPLKDLPFAPFAPLAKLLELDAAYRSTNNTAVNLGSYEVQGVDFEAKYTLPMEQIWSGLNCSLKGQPPFPPA